MEKTIIRLKRKIENLSAIVRRLENFEEGIPQIEVDLLLEELRRMYEVALSLNELSVVSHLQPKVPQLEKQEVINAEIALNAADTTIESIAPMAKAMSPTVVEVVEHKGMKIVDSLEEDTHLKEETVEDTKIIEIGLNEKIDTDTITNEVLSKEEVAPLFVPEAHASETVQPNPEMPTLEQLEGANNEELFADGPLATSNFESSSILEPEATQKLVLTEDSIQSIQERSVDTEASKPLLQAEILAQEKQSPTLWEKLQGQQPNQSFADVLQSQQSIVDRLVEEKIQVTSIPKSTHLATSNISADRPMESTKLGSTNIEHVKPEVQDSPLPQSTNSSQPISTAKTATASIFTSEHPASPSLFDYFKQAPIDQGAPGTARVLGDSLNKYCPSVEENLEQQTSKHKVADLRAIININDKFSFMNELFHNNMKAYNDFIIRLNSINNREEALQIVSNVASQYNWDMDSLTVKTFYNLLDRKY